MATKAQETVTVNLQPLIGPMANLLGCIFISLAIIAGSLNISNSGIIAGTATAGTGTDTAVADTTPTIATVNIDDDPIKGDANASVYIVEFSDYECPFCQAFYNDTLGQIQSTYIDSGDVAFVYRDLPLSFHDPMATYAANVMECADDQGGDDAYYAMHDFWFENTATNGTGITNEQLIIDAAKGAGLNSQSLLDCADAGTFTEEIQADSADATAVGITGTPGFIVGTIDADGNVTGEIISGAYPFAEFDRVIQQYL